MNTNEFIKIMDSGAEVIAKSETHLYMTYLSNEAMKITAELNNSYHTPEEIGALMEKLTGKPFPEGVYMFPPFYTDCGKNIKLGKMKKTISLIMIPSILFVLSAYPVSATNSFKPEA